jgi:chromosome partitioning protein
MGKTIAIVNQKGGVGKTTTSINLASALAMLDKKVLLLDLDPQGNATAGSGVYKEDFSLSAKDVLLNEATLTAATVMTPGNFALLPTTADLIIAEVHLMQAALREIRLKTALESVQTLYDYILIDCPPALNILTVNALAAADSVLIPVQCEYFALEGLSSLLNTIEQVQRTINPSLHIEGLLRTMYDGRNRLALDVSKQLLQHFPGRVYRTVIPRNVRLAEAPSHGLPILQYDAKSLGAFAYNNLAQELVEQSESAGASLSSTEQEKEVL